MTPNWAAAVVNTLVLAFFVVIAISIGFNVYAARAMKRMEEQLKQQTKAE
ncbi:MAG: hypothetical protein Q7W30_02355 [Coriobacteriia bacterium]|nr:hypothetical protein [Coriobacteriia bacterium]